MELNEIALIMLVIAPFIYMIVNCKYKYEKTLNREQRRKKKQSLL